MNARAVTYSLCRLIGLYMVVNYGLNLLANIGLLLLSPEIVAASGGWVSSLLGVTLMASYVIIGIVLWTGASWFAMRIATPFPEAFRDDMGAAAWQRLVISGAGWLCLINAFRLANSGISAFINPSSDKHEVVEIVVPAAIYFGASLLLILAPSAIVNGLEALRAWGRKMRDWGSKPLVEDEKS